MGIERARYSARRMTADATSVITGSAVGAFIPKTNGFITVTDAAGTVVVDAVPVTAGVRLDLELLLQTIGGTVTLSGGASGTLLV